jgi:steroid delta-isomerase-like uncharacterized protein
VAETTTPTNARTSAKQAEAPSEPKAAGRKRITRRKAVEAHIRGYFEALAARDTETALGHWGEDVVADIVPLGVLRGRAEFKGFLDGLIASVPDVELTVERLVAGEREAVVEWRRQGTFNGAQFQGIEATGGHIELRGVDVFQVEDGEIVGETAYYDSSDFARQIGMLPPQDSGAERAMKGAFNALTKVKHVVNERRQG